MSLGEEVGAITPLVRAMLALEPTSSASTSIITLYDGPCVLHVLILNFANPFLLSVEKNIKICLQMVELLGAEEAALVSPLELCVCLCGGVGSAVSE